MKEEYKQKVGNINYIDKVVNISLTREEWSWSETWTQCKNSERVGRDWFDDLHWMFMMPISHDINFSGKNYSYQEDITFQIPRELLRIFVYSIGSIAYDLDVKPIVSIIAQEIIGKINKQIKEQLPVDDSWFKYGF
jgi:hypothetical protein